MQSYSNQLTKTKAFPNKGRFKKTSACPTQHGRLLCPARPSSTLSHTWTLYLTALAKTIPRLCPPNTYQPMPFFSCCSQRAYVKPIFFQPPPVTITIMSNWNRGSADNGPKAHSRPHLHNNNHSNRFFVEGAGQQIFPRKKRHEKEARKHRSAEVRFRPHHSDNNNNNFDRFFLGGGQATRTTSVEEGKSTALQARSQRAPPTPATTTTPAFFLGGGAQQQLLQHKKENAELCKQQASRKLPVD